jgi:hypothetical protein
MGYTLNPTGALKGGPDASGRWRDALGKGQVAGSSRWSLIGETENEPRSSIPLASAEDFAFNFFK